VGRHVEPLRILEIGRVSPALATNMVLLNLAFHDLRV
jgi:hypothetical protein